MTDRPQDHGERIVRLEQSFADAIPMIRESLDKVVTNQDSLKDLVIELAEQAKKFPAIDEDMRQLQKDLNHLSRRVDGQEHATKSLDRDLANLDGAFSKFVNEEFKDFIKDFRALTEGMNKNRWTLGLVRFVVVSLFGGAITLLVAILAGVITT